MDAALQTGLTGTKLVATVPNAVLYRAHRRVPHYSCSVLTHTVRAESPDYRRTGQS